MSELVTTQDRNPQLRLRLLATVSAVALSAQIVPASAQSSARPVVWIELGAQYEDVTGKDDPFVPPFDAAARTLGLPSITEIESVLGKSFGGEGRLSFQPQGSDWIFMASARYGRTRTARHAHEEKQIIGPLVGQYLSPGGKHFRTAQGNAYLATPSVAAYVDQNVDDAEAHTIADFQVGKDVGLGLFGHRTESMVAFGARYLQLSYSARANSNTVADGEFSLKKFSTFGPGKYGINKTHHNSASSVNRNGNVRALGPSLSISNATGLLGNVNDGELAVDWGANVGVLFGRQRTHVQHQTTTRELGPGIGNGQFASPYNVRSVQRAGATATRTRHVIVPNIGGFAAVSYRLPDAKVSMGYRADFFFGALDRGLGTRDSVTTGFHGPFATVSFGLGG